jgi:hypothetical protein
MFLYMIMSINKRKAQFIYNFSEKSTQDVLLLAPRGREIFGLGAQDTVEALQKIVDCLVKITGIRLENAKWLENGNARFHPKIIVGYHNEGDYWDIHNTIRLSWECLELENKTIASCTHELVHPFFKIFFYSSKNLRQKAENENWGDGFCDFLRIFIIETLVKNLGVNLHERIGKREYNWKEDDFEEYMRGTEQTGDHWERYHKPALRLLKKFRVYSQLGENRRKNQEEALRVFLRILFDAKNLEEIITKEY